MNRHLGALQHFRLGDEVGSKAHYEKARAILEDLLPEEVRASLQAASRFDPEKGDAQLPTLPAPKNPEEAELYATVARAYGYLGDWYRDFGELKNRLLTPKARGNAKYHYDAAKQLRQHVSDYRNKSKTESGPAHEIWAFKARRDLLIAQENDLLFALAQRRTLKDLGKSTTLPQQLIEQCENRRKLEDELIEFLKAQPTNNEALRLKKVNSEELVFFLMNGLGHLPRRNNWTAELTSIAESKKSVLELLD